MAVGRPRGMVVVAAWRPDCEVQRIGNLEASVGLCGHRRLPEKL